MAIRILILLWLTVDFGMACTISSKYDDITPMPPKKFLDEKEANYQCGPVPLSIYTCIEIDFISEGIVRLCRNARPKKSVCEHTVCIFRHSGWMFGSNINYTALRAAFFDFSVAHPETKGAVKHIVRKCVSPDIKPQSLFRGCPSFDMLNCAMNVFIKHASPMQWRKSDHCKGIEEYAKYCPLCPSECFEILNTVPEDVCTPCFPGR